MNNENGYSQKNDGYPLFRVVSPEILFITSYPPRECGIATYSQDLIKALKNKFHDSFSLKVCAVESGKVTHSYPEEVKYVLDAKDPAAYVELALAINTDQNLAMVLVQHEFGLFHVAEEYLFYSFLKRLKPAVITVFHTVLPHPEHALKTEVSDIAESCSSVIVMTNHSAQVLQEDYDVPAAKIAVIPHGTHLVQHLDKALLKAKYGLSGRKVLSTFGLLRSGKDIHTTLDALPAIIEINPEAIFLLMSNEALRSDFSSSTLQRIVPSAWENSAIAHGLLFEQVAKQPKRPSIALQYRMPPVKLDHVKKMTTDFGMIQFSKINQPDLETGYTLDDNARALIAVCMHYEHTGDLADLKYLEIYLQFMQFCYFGNGDFLNYVDKETHFTTQNNSTNLEDANGRAIWALGFFISKSPLLPETLTASASELLQQAITGIEKMHSPRAMAFSLKGLFYSNQQEPSLENTRLIEVLANRLAQMYRHESEHGWHWFESYLTYANSILPEAMLLAWEETGDPIYKAIALTSFHFLLSQTFNENGIEVISNKKWLHKGQSSGPPGEQPIDVAYTILALSHFFDVFGKENYRRKLEIAFNWFLGNNRLHQIIYNPCTGGCYDGLEATHVNLNQGAESTLSYLMARLTMEKYRKGVEQKKIAELNQLVPSEIAMPSSIGLKGY